MANIVYLLLGANLGDRVAQLAQARALLEEEVTQSFSCSTIYESAAWGLEDQPSFLNQVVALETDMDPETLLGKILAIEEKLGRERKTVWGPRVIDIDMLFFGNEIIEKPDLIIPHKLFHERKFAMVPMAELAPEFVHPVIGQTVKELLDRSQDALEVKIWRPSAEVWQIGDLHYLTDLTSGDPDMISQIIQLFLQQTPGDLKQLGDSIRAEDWPKVRQWAHHIKPTLAYVGAESLRKQFEQIESLARNGGDSSVSPIFEGIRPDFAQLFRELQTYLESGSGNA